MSTRDLHDATVSLIKENILRIVCRSCGARHPREHFSNMENPTIARHLYHRLDPGPCVLCGEVGSIINSAGHEALLFAFRRYEGMSSDYAKPVVGGVLDLQKIWISPQLPN